MCTLLVRHHLFERVSKLPIHRMSRTPASACCECVASAYDGARDFFHYRHYCHSYLRVIFLCFRFHVVFIILTSLCTARARMPACLGAGIDRERARDKYNTSTYTYT